MKKGKRRASLYGPIDQEKASGSIPCVTPSSYLALSPKEGCCCDRIQRVENGVAEEPIKQADGAFCR
jgi:hypothetical protein